MAIQKPYNISLSGKTIDSAEINRISWSTSGDTQVAYSINIYKNSDGTLAWSLPKTNSYSLYYDLTSGNLINGLEYKTQITVYDSNNNSAVSDFCIFQTSSRPVVTVSPIGTVAAQSNVFSATYSQGQSISLRSWIAYLYDSSQSLIDQSPITTTTPLSYTFTGLNTGKVYYIEFFATSSLGLTGTSGKVSFTTSFAQPNLSSNIVATNVDNAGINLSWYVNQITGTSTSTTYINNEKLDVTSGNVTFDKGFTIDQDFTLKLWIDTVTNVQFSDTTDVVVSASQPTNNVNTIWLVDSSKTTPQSISFVSSYTTPINITNLWVVDSTQTTEQTLGVNVDTTQPSNTSVVWVNTINPKNGDFELLRLIGNNGLITLEYTNGAFNLFTIINGVKILASTYTVAGNSYYLYIQQTGSTLNLSAQALS
jgi:hypothetical protein